MPSRLDFIQRANASYIEQLYQRYRENPDSVPEDWAIFFAGFDLAGETSPVASATLVPSGQPTAGVFGLVLAYREFGHLIARLDPLAQNPESHPLLELSNFGLSEADLDREVDPRPFIGEFRGTLRELIAALRETYCHTLGVEYMEIFDKGRRDWLTTRMERNRNRPELSEDERLRLLENLLVADAFEQFLHVKYVGQKRFSLEGGASLIPMLETLIEASAEMGVEQLVIGMPHRGRLNVLVNIMKKPLELVFSEFESGFRPEEVQGHGDVKYHLGYSSLHDSRAGKLVHLDLNFNPSHLEFVNPVVLGSLRSRQMYMNDEKGERGIPVLIHGDAAFAGEGIVAETLTLSQLPAYRTGGTLHLIVNNQVGFTTSPEDARPMRYATDLAKVVVAPVFHVNGDDPEMCVHAVRLAAEYRRQFNQDAFVDLVCYRKHGHNELDDPTFTQPVMYRQIAQHVPASRQYAQRLIRAGVIDHARLEAIEKQIAERLNAAHRRARADASVEGEVSLGGAWQGLEWAGHDWSADTRVPRGTLQRIITGAARAPQGFHVHPKVEKLLRDRIEMVEQDRIDWGTGEVLSLGSLLLDGFRVRLSGQDTGRGTFSHRHAVLHDAEDGALYVPLQHLDAEQGRFDVIDTMLSEAAALGFEYGYSTADPNTLVIWEAQFGDFANVAQVYIDQFIASAESKWRRMSGLTLLLPHGYEGQGPEHSSARIERFLELCADGNIQVCNLTTPAQLFHALRRQMHRKFRKPLVIASPKSLLRHKLAVSTVAEFSEGAFSTAIDDAAVPDAEEVRTLILTSGRIYFTLHEARSTRNAADVALVRLEQMYPFPRYELGEIFARYPHAREVRWVQEEPENMGAWRHLRHRLESVLPEGVSLKLVARRAAPTPATGYYHMHVEQEKSLIERAFGDPDALPQSLPSMGGAAASRRRAKP
jgi:2-oxoglutarate dehydrogenase E1 component